VFKKYYDILGADEDASPETFEKQARQEKLDDSLFLAIRAGDIRGVRKAVRGGAHVNSEQDNISVIVYAVAYRNIKIIRYLLKQGADANVYNGAKIPILVMAMSTTPKGYWSLNSRIVRLLLKHGANPRATSKLGCSLFTYADCLDRWTLGLARKYAKNFPEDRSRWEIHLEILADAITGRAAENR